MMGNLISTLELDFPRIQVFIIFISNSNWTDWSTIQGVIARVISKSDEPDYVAGARRTNHDREFCHSVILQ